MKWIGIAILSVFAYIQFQVWFWLTIKIGKAIVCNLLTMDCEPMEDELLFLILWVIWSNQLIYFFKVTSDDQKRN